MAKKKPVLFDEEATAEGSAHGAMKAWHRDRMEWVDRALRVLTIVNAGGAVADAAFMGTILRSGVSPSTYLVLSLVSFSLGLILILGYIIYRFRWAEYRVWYLRRIRDAIWDERWEVDLKEIKTQHPPTRPQFWITYGCNGLSFFMFISGLILAFIGVANL